MSSWNCFGKYLDHDDHRDDDWQSTPRISLTIYWNSCSSHSFNCLIIFPSYWPEKKNVYLVNGGEPSSSTTSNPMFQLSRNPDKSHREIFYSLTFFVLSTCFQHAPNRNAHASCLLLTVSWENKGAESVVQCSTPWIYRGFNAISCELQNLRRNQRDWLLFVSTNIKK